MDESLSPAERRKASDRARTARYRRNHPDRVSGHQEALRIRNRKHVLAVKANTPCTDCGQKFPAVCMDFDHLDGEDKDASISHMVNSRVSLARIDAEIAKCELVCANCHRIRTARRGQFWEPCQLAPSDS